MQITNNLLEDLRVGGLKRKKADPKVVGEEKELKGKEVPKRTKRDTEANPEMAQIQVVTKHLA